VIALEWKPATIESVKPIVQNDLANCDHNQAAACKTYGVEPHRASIVRSGNLEYVVLVAHKGNQVIDRENVEEGLGVSVVGADGQILEHDCGQNDLGLALNGWTQQRDA
jgi:hypothetical protein